MKQPSLVPKLSMCSNMWQDVSDVLTLPGATGCSDSKAQTANMRVYDSLSACVDDTIRGWNCKGRLLPGLLQQTRQVLHASHQLRWPVDAWGSRG